MAEDLDTLSQIYNDLSEAFPPGHPELIKLQNKILATGASSTQITESLEKTKPKIVSTSGEVYNEATGTYEKPVASSGGGGFSIGPIKIGGVIGDFLGEAAEFVDDTFVQVRDFVVDNKFEVAALVVTAGGSAVLTAGQKAVAATVLNAAGKVDKGASVGEAIGKTALTAVGGDVISTVTDVVTPVISNTINVSEDMINLATNTAISVGFSGGDFKTFIIATAGSKLYDDASTQISNTLKNTIDLPDIKIDKLKMLLVTA